MPSFYDQIKSLNESSQRTVKSSPAEISALCRKSEKYIQSMVAQIKSDILQKAKSGKLSYVEKRVDSFFLHNVSIKRTKPHYASGVLINYRIDVSRSVLEYGQESYYEDGSLETRMIYTVSDYEVLEYMVKRVIELLAQDKIYPVGGRDVLKWDAATILEVAGVKKNFKEASAIGKGYRYSLPIRCAMFM